MPTTQRSLRDQITRRKCERQSFGIGPLANVSVTFLSIWGELGRTEEVFDSAG
jgi:hypothetical protein